MDMDRRVFTLGAALWPAAAAAQDAKLGGVMTVIVPFPAGGSVDAVARLVQPGLQERLGANIVIDNKGGAAGSLGAAQAARSAPDGRTWLFVFDSHSVNPFLQKLTFDTERDLVPVSLIGTAPNVLATHPSRPFRSLADVVEAAKAKPGTLSYATIGAGSLGHLTMVRLGKRLGIELNHVPYRGGGPALNDAIAGHVDLIIGSAALINPQLTANALRPLVQFGASRAGSPQLKDVPTIGESGVADLESYAWWGVFAPKGTPQAMIDRFGADLRATLRDARVASMLAEAQQIDVRATDGPEFQRFFANEMRLWGAVVRDNNIQVTSQ